MKYGYVRVSTKDQKLARQINILRQNNVDKIFEEKESGAIYNRPVLMKLLDILKSGDQLIVTSVDRLSRDQDHLTKLLIQFSLKNVEFIALDIPTFAEVDNPNTQRLLKALIMELHKYTAAEERLKIKERQRQGIDIAKKRGVYKGKKIMYGPNVKDEKKRETFFKVKEMISQGHSINKIMKEANVSSTLIYRIKSELK